MISWTSREPPLPPTGALAVGPVAARWRSRLLRASDEALAGWTGVGSASLVVVLGEALPWVDGLVWLGVDPEAPGLWLPCGRRPSVHPALLGRRLPLPAALLEDRVIPLGAARPLARDRLAP